MNFTDAPGYTPIPFANSGTKNVIPSTSQPGGAASFPDGFPAPTFEPISSGGIPPAGADFNGILFDLSSGQRFQQAGGVYGYDATFSAAIGGYPKGALLKRSDGNGYWMSLTDANTTNPDTGGANWASVRTNIGTTTIAMVVGSNTPTAEKLAAETLLLTGSIASAATLVLPLTAGANWIVVNNTTGAGAVNVQGATGASVAIPQGVALQVFTDGVGFYAIAAPTTGEYLPINGTAVAATKLATARAFSISGLATAAGVNFDGTGNVALNVTAMNVPGALGYTPANDASVVHIAGAETITGSKTFGATTVFNGATGESINFQDDGFSVAMVMSGTNKRLWIRSNTVLMDGSLTCPGGNFTSSDRSLKRDIQKFSPRPLHRSVPFVSYVLKENGWHGLGSVAQSMQKTAPEHVGEFDWNGKARLSLNYAGAAYEQSMWAGQEVDRLTKRIAKLERALERAKIEPRKRGFARRLLEAIW